MTQSTTQRYHSSPVTSEELKTELTFEQKVNMILREFGGVIIDDEGNKYKTYGDSRQHKVEEPIET